jgi:hypothetical protein
VGQRGTTGTAEAWYRYNRKGQLPQARIAAAERKEGVMRRVIGLMAGCLGFIAAIMLIFWIMGGFEGGGGSVGPGQKGRAVGAAWCSRGLSRGARA